MELDEIGKMMLEALTSDPLVKKVDEQLQARNAYQETLRKQQRFVRDREYTCRACGNITNLTTVLKFNNINLGGAMHSFEFLAQTNYGQYVFKDDDVVFVGNPVAFVVCSEECRRTWLKKWGRANKVVVGWCRYFIDMPPNIVVYHSLEPLKSDIPDEKGKTFREKLDQIELLVDGPKGFYLWGAPGNGKTTIAAWLAYEYLVRENAVRCVTYSQMQQVLDAKVGFDEQVSDLVYQDVQVDGYTKKLRHGKPWDVVIVDDISDDFAPSSQQHRRLKKLFMEWYENGSKLVITSNVNTKTLATAISPAIDSRLTQTVNSVHFPDVDYRNFKKV